MTESRSGLDKHGGEQTGYGDLRTAFAPSGKVGRMGEVVEGLYLNHGEGTTGTQMLRVIERYSSPNGLEASWKRLWTLLCSCVTGGGFCVENTTKQDLIGEAKGGGVFREGV